MKWEAEAEARAGETAGKETGSLYCHCLLAKPMQGPEFSTQPPPALEYNINSSPWTSRLSGVIWALATSPTSVVPPRSPSLTAFLFLKHSKFIPAPGPLHLVCSLPGMLPYPATPYPKVHSFTFLMSLTNATS